MEPSEERLEFAESRIQALEARVEKLESALREALRHLDSSISRIFDSMVARYG